MLDALAGSSALANPASRRLSVGAGIAGGAGESGPQFGRPQFGRRRLIATPPPCSPPPPSSSMQPLMTGLFWAHPGAGRGVCRNGRGGDGGTDLVGCLGGRLGASDRPAVRPLGREEPARAGSDPAARRSGRRGPSSSLLARSGLPDQDRDLHPVAQILRLRRGPSDRLCLAALPGRHARRRQARPRAGGLRPARARWTRSAVSCARPIANERPAGR